MNLKMQNAPKKNQVQLLIDLEKKIIRKIMGGCLSIDSMHDDNPVALPSTTASQTTSGNQQRSIFAEQQFVILFFVHFCKYLLGNGVPLC